MPELSRRESPGVEREGHGRAEPCLVSLGSGTAVTGRRRSMAREPAPPLFTPVTAPRPPVTGNAESSGTADRDELLKRDELGSASDSSLVR